MLGVLSDHRLDLFALVPLGEHEPAAARPDRLLLGDAQHHSLSAGGVRALAYEGIDVTVRRISRRRLADALVHIAKDCFVPGQTLRTIHTATT